MNQASREVVNKITDAIVFPSIGCTLTQEEADAIKEYVQTRFFEDNIQGAVHSGFVRRESEGGMMTDERLVEIALGGTATKEESEEMAMMLLNWHKADKDGPMLEEFNIFSIEGMRRTHESS